jgi:hypothetical protein
MKRYRYILTTVAAGGTAGRASRLRAAAASVTASLAGLMGVDLALSELAGAWK